MYPKKSVKRLAPTSKTIRQLYLLSGNQCAFPGCSHPIILDSGEYVGELCHICAAEKGGERFNESQSNEDRRQIDNLLLMCHSHHVLTNDVSKYPPDRMRQIKTEHESRFAAGLASMTASSSAIHIENSIVSLGGEGGRAPGAGGGGGGAIGSNAKAGRGGDGGRLFWQEEDQARVDITHLGYPKKAKALLESIHAYSNSKPGAGGGGGGAIGDDMRAGDGGHGGDSVAGSIFLQPGKYRVEIGKGGLAATLPGQHGFSGGDTRLLDESGKVISQVSGGRRVRSASSYLPEGVRELTHEDVLTGINMPILVPANKVESREGLIYLQGGGWDFFPVQRGYNDLVWNIVAIIQRNALSEQTGFYIGLCNPAGKEMACQAMVIPPHLRTVHFTVSIGAKFDTPGIWKVIAYSGEYVLADFTVDVRIVE